MGSVQFRVPRFEGLVFVCTHSNKLSVIRQKRIPSHRPLEGHNSWLENDGPNLGVVGGWEFEIGAGSPGEGSGPDFIGRKRLFVNQTKFVVNGRIEPF